MRAGQASDDEPLFVLRSTDSLAPVLVREWVRRAREQGVGEAKLQEAEQLAGRMEAWANAHGGAELPD